MQQQLDGKGHVQGGHLLHISSCRYLLKAFSYGFKSGTVLIIKMLILSQYVSLRASPAHAQRSARHATATELQTNLQLIGCQITPLIIPGHPIVNNPNDNKSNIQGQCARCSEVAEVDKHEGMVVLPCKIYFLCIGRNTCRKMFFGLSSKIRPR